MKHGFNCTCNPLVSAGVGATAGSNSLSRCSLFPILWRETGAIWTDDYEVTGPFLNVCVICVGNLRSDGRIGFPGGHVDEICPNETDIVLAVNRELVEEINYEARIGLQHYVMSHLHLNVKNAGRSLVTHFFVKKVDTEDEFRRITRDHMKGKDSPCPHFRS